LIFTETNAVLETEFVGKHTREFAEIPAINKSVWVPFCVVYDLEKDKIKKARIYFEVD